MKFLVDTNLWLERLLEQENAEEVERFLDQIAPDQLLVSDFTLHSIGVILSRLNRLDLFLRFVQDVFLDGGVTVVSLQPEEMERLAEVATSFRLDFDDAYQYVVAEKYGAVLVSFDGDFDRTERGRRTPAEVLRGTA